MNAIIIKQIETDNRQSTKILVSCFQNVHVCILPLFSLEKKVVKYQWDIKKNSSREMQKSKNKKWDTRKNKQVHKTLQRNFILSKEYLTKTGDMVRSIAEE